MSEPLASYTFLPWLRRGIANNISDADGNTSVKLRTSILIQVKVSGLKPDNTVIPAQTINQNIELYGPGDIIGIDSKAIIKSEPHNWITNFEPNYLPYIDFYEEDFPWRYTPAASSGERLRPWLTLLVLKEDEFDHITNVKAMPLPGFKLKESIITANVFPKSDELWAWAHVHVNTDLADGTAPATANVAQVTQKITNMINQTPDLSYSRIISPRKLEANKSYYAFLIPTFESGRLAGLGKTIDKNTVATACAWDNAVNKEFPYYHRWYFKTGNIGDFEYLVNLIEPKLADKTVGVRDLDALHPGVNLPLIDNPELNGVLKLGGALRVPFKSLNESDKAEVLKYEEWDEHPYPHKFTQAMANRINIADDYTQGTKTIEQINKEAGIILENDEGDPDPVITSPLYGRWHALQQRLLKDRNNNNLPYSKNWIHELNLDPRYRVAARLGTGVVQKNQEEYMQASWEQVGKIVEANNKIRWAQMATEVSYNLYEKHILTQLPEKVFSFTAPVHRRIIHQQFSVQAQVSQSLVPTAMTSGVFRSVTRPRGAFMKKLRLTDDISTLNLIQRVNEGKVLVVPPKVDPAGAINLSDVIKDAKPKNLPEFLARWLEKYSWFKYLPLIILLLILLIIYLFLPSFQNSPTYGTIVSIGVGLFYILNRWDKQLKDINAASQENQTPESVDSFSKSPDFTISNPGSDFKPSKGNTDSLEATRFKLALKDTFNLVSTKYVEAEKTRLNLSSLNTTILQAIDPSYSIPNRIGYIVKFPPHIKKNLIEKFTPVMAYPEIDIPMYKPLVNISSELFLPNLNKIEQNSITLLENNQKFIESYMVGLNHEMSRELLWREYPTDQRGTCFRQFWDVHSFFPSQPPPDNLKEQLKDITPIHKWSKINTTHINQSDPNSVRKNELGANNQRASNNGKTQLVLVIRGELLKKYPTAVVYAQKSEWGKKDNVPDLNEERTLVELTFAEKKNPPESKLKNPLFEAKIDPDIYFFGFDLDDEEARGTKNPTSTSDNPGWFFVLKERPGEPRFGLDLNKADKIINWNNLSWEDVGTADGKCIELNKTITFDQYDATIDQENKPMDDDVQARWSPSTNAAELAYILYQVPSMVAVHASRMLP